MEKFYRNHTPTKIDGSSINFQAIDWTETNEDLSKDPGEENDFFSPVTETYVIRAFGVTELGQSVCCNIVHFLPFFYVKVPNNWQKTDVSVFLARLIGSQIKSKKGNYWNSLEKYKDCFIKEKCILQKKHEFYGFTGKKEYKFLKLVFNNSFALSNTVKVLNQHNDSTSEIKGYSFKFKIYESNLNSLLRFFHKKDIKPCGWMSVDDYIVNNVKVSKCQIEITVNWKSMKPLVNLSNSQLLQATFDIETDSGDGHSFPMAKNVNDYVIQIATTFKKANESSFYLRHLICLKECAPITKEEIDSECEVIVESYNTEVEVILAWTKLIIKMDPDIIYGYNSDSFDFKYIYDRAVSLNCIDDFLKISRIHHIPAEMRSRSFYSTARGYTEFNRLKIHGRVNFDVMIYIQITFKLVKYTLDFVSRHFLGDNKVPLDYKEMFRLFKKGNPDGIKTVGVYCLKDTDLPQKLVDKLLILQTQISMSNITYVPITYLIERGQQIKTFSLMLKTTAKLNYVVPTLFSYNEDDDRKVFKRSVDDDSDSDKEDDEFTGATVLPPKSGAYYIPVVTNDFKSLYPSIMMAHGLCHSTIVLNDKFLGLPGFTYTNHSWEDIKKDGTIVKHSNTYARDNSLKEKEIYGILPKILEGLVNERQFYKDEMKKAKKAGDSFIASVFDANQSAVKLTMNSIYGFLGANMLPCVKIASTVTYLGRKMIEASKNYVEKEFKGSEVIYGDTDSIFITFNTKKQRFYEEECQRVNNQVVITENDNLYLGKLKTEIIKEAMELGDRSAKLCTEVLFKYPIELDYEKTNMPCILFTKKRYIIQKYENDPEIFKVTSKGILLNRRDNFKLSKKIYQKIVDILMSMNNLKDKRINEIYSLINDTIQDIITKKIDISDLIVVKTYNPPKKNHNLAQIVLANKIKERDPGKAPRYGDKISYVLTETDNPKDPQYKKAEDPDYVMENNLPLDLQYYIQYLEKPLCQLLANYIDNPKEIFRTPIKEYKAMKKLQKK